MDTKFKVGDRVTFDNETKTRGTVDEVWAREFVVNWDNGVRQIHRMDNASIVADQDPVVSPFEDQVRTTLESLGDMLIEKNKAYGDSALNPVRIFSKAAPVEQIMVRIDDKLSRLARGAEYAGDDTVTDLLGYLVLLKIARDGQSDAVPDA